MSRRISVGTRGSALALAQARLVTEALERDGRQTRTVIVETAGDRRAPDTAWGEGAFVAAIEQALLDGRVDVAVHSAKDVPTEQDPRLAIGAYLRRADPRDALVVGPGGTAHSIDDLPSGARVGTDSPRRAGFLRARRPDVIVHPLHGNVDTRLRRLDAGETDALILACAGLDRLGLGGRITQRIEPAVVPPAAGQGAVAVQIRRDDARMLGLTAAIDHRPTRLAVEAERTFLEAAGGGCRAPLGALAELAGDELEILGGHVGPDGSGPAFGRRHGPIATGESMARDLADALGPAPEPGPEGEDGAAGHSMTVESVAPRVLVTRAESQSDHLAEALRTAGVHPVAVPAIAVEIDRREGRLDTVIADLIGFRWVVVTSVNGAHAVLAAAARTRAASTALRTPAWAAIGAATASSLTGAGIDVAFQPTRANAASLATELPLEAGDRVLIVRGDLADGGLADRLRARGADVDDVIGYRTREAPPSSRPLLRAATTAAAPPLAAVVFTSGSTVRGLLLLADAEAIDIRSVPAICIGPETARAATGAGFHVVATAPTTDVASLARVTAAALVPTSEIA